jgi:acyl-coenzyme A thioesterase PaaI-like protein
MLTSDVLRAAVAGDGEERVLTLERAFQGLPDTAHGGSVLAVFDVVAGQAGGRRLVGHYLKRVPLGAPLRLRIERAAAGPAFELLERDAVLVRGQVVLGVDGAGPTVAAPAADAAPLPISRTCFACGIDNPLGLRVQLRADTHAVGGTWTPGDGFSDGGRLATVALTTLMDEAAFWLGALATGEAGMTTELRVTLHAEPAAGSPITVAGARAAVQPRGGDSRYQDTTLTARDADGRLVASAAITFVAVRGAARRLVSGLLAMNPPEMLRGIFPAYAPTA